PRPPRLAPPRLSGPCAPRPGARSAGAVGVRPCDSARRGQDCAPSAMTDPAHRSRAGMLAATGLALGVLGVVGYFVLVMNAGARFPSIRNHAIPSWILVALGLALSVLAVTRARRRLLAGTLLGVNVALAAAFFAMLYV